MRKYLLLLMFMFVPLIPAIFVWVVDPYQYFHRSYFSPMKFIKGSERMQMPGIIRNYIAKDTEFDTIIMGGSLSQNFEPKKIVDVLDGKKKALTFSFSGATPSEQVLVTAKALDTGNVNSILWSLGVTWNKGLDTFNNNHHFPDYLYNTNPIDDFNYLYSLSVINRSISYYLKHTWISKFEKTYIEYGLPKISLRRWHEYGAWAPFNEEQMLRMNTRMFSSRVLKQETRRLAASEKNVTLGKRFISEFNDLPKDAFSAEEKVLKDFLEKYPNVEFTFFIPPISAFYYHSANQLDMEKTVYRAKAVVEIIKDYPNAKVVGFADQAIINDLRNYKDTVHFGRNIYRYMTKKIDNNEGFLTQDNVAQYTNSLIAAIHSFDRKNPFALPADAQKINFEGEWVGNSEPALTN